MLISSTDIVSMCAKLGALSANQAGLQPADFLNLANLVMMTMTSELYAAREDYLTYTEKLPIVGLQAYYRVPPRALNGNIRHLWFEDIDGTRGRLFVKALEDIEFYNATATGTSPNAYMMHGNDIVLLPTPANSRGNLVVSYPFRPNQLVDATTCQQITLITGQTVTVSNIPTNFGNVLYDIIDHRSGNGIVAYDLLGSVNVAARTITFTGDISKVQVGNWLALAGQSPYAMIPEEGHPLLAETTVLRVEMLRGNKARIANSSSIVQDARRAWDALLLSRVLSKPMPAGSGGAQFPLRPW